MRPLAFRTIELRPLAVTLAALLIVILLVLVWWSTRKRPIFSPAPQEVLTSLIKETRDKDKILSALSNNLDYLERTGPKERKQVFGGISISGQRLIETTKALISMVQQNKSDTASSHMEASGLKVFEIQGEVLVTGYYLPELAASRKKGPDYTTPVLGVPEDLITVKLADFLDGPGYEHLTLRGRLEGQRLVPYYTRKEIRHMMQHGPFPVIAFLKGPVDLLKLQIQGSGILKFPDGTTSYVHYAADNGHPYKSVGKALISKGLLTKDEADWEGIEKWFESHPKMFNPIVDENPRYIFFKEEPEVEQAIGAQGVPLVPLHSVAVDSSALPLGGIYILELDVPGMGHIKNLVAGQDIGGAIKGPRHVDLYIGRGEEAGRIAGSLKAKGRLWLILVDKATE